MELTWKKLKSMLSEAQGRKKSDALDRAGEAMKQAFSPEAEAKRKAEVEAKRNADPKFQEFKDRRAKFKAKVEANYDPKKHMEWAQEQDKRWGYTSDHPNSFTRRVGKPHMFEEDTLEEWDNQKDTKSPLDNNTSNSPPSMLQKMKDKNKNKSTDTNSLQDQMEKERKKKDANKPNTMNSQKSAFGSSLSKSTLE